MLGSGQSSESSAALQMPAATSRGARRGGAVLNCREFLTEFGDYLDGSLAEEVHQELEAHLSQCRTCQVIHDSTQKTLRLVSDSGSFELPAAAAESLVTKIMALVLKQEIADRRRAETAVRKSNQELTKTLQALRSTQARLVQTAKMASLLHLVAGIAHEINSPVGAVSSASDVTDRCLEKIEHAIDRGDGENLKRTLGVLAEANRVTATAGRRMAEIVRTLGSFAGLLSLTKYYDTFGFLGASIYVWATQKV